MQDFDDIDMTDAEAIDHQIGERHAAIDHLHGETAALECHSAEVVVASASTDPWLVCDMDDGLLRGEQTRAAAVSWLCTYHDGRVLARHSYGPGRYEYAVGDSADDAMSAFIVHRGQLTRDGWDPHQQPLYPIPDDPFEKVDRDHGDLEGSGRQKP